MLIQFQTDDDSIFLADTEQLFWMRVSEPPTFDSGSLAAIPLEEGKLTAQGYGIYAMEGRTPNSPAPGKGLCSFGVIPIPKETTLFLYLRANTKIKSWTMPRPIDTIRYEIAPDISQQVFSQTRTIAKPVAAGVEIKTSSQSEPKGLNEELE